MGRSPRRPSGRAQTRAASTSDVVLVNRASQGERSAFDELFRRHAHPAWRLGMAVGGNAEVAEHSVVEAFTSVFRHVESGSATLATPFRQLLVRETIAVAVADGRSGIAPAANGETGTGGAGAAGGAVGEPNPLISAYRSLPDQWRTVLWLSEVEGGTAQQIGSLLGIATEPAARLATRARTGLRRRFARDGGSPGDSLLADLGAALRPLVVPMPASVPAAAAAWWLAWRDISSERRHGLGAVMPFGSWAEKALAGATAGVLTAGIAAAIALGGREATRRSPYLAERAGTGELAGGAASTTSPTSGGSSAPSSARALRHTEVPSTGTGSATSADAAPASPASPIASRTGSNPNSGTPVLPPPGTQPPPAEAAPGTGVSVALNPGGVPVGVSLGDRPGVQAGTVTAGDPPPPSSGPVTIKISSGGALPPIVVTLP